MAKLMNSRMSMGAIAPARRGVTLVEVAISALLLLLVTFGVLEYGWMFRQQAYVTNAARQGARVAARADSTAEQAKVAARAALANGIGQAAAAAASVQVVPDPIPNDYPTGNPITVIVSVGYYQDGEGISLGLPLVPKPNALKAKTVMAREGT